MRFAVVITLIALTLAPWPAWAADCAAASTQAAMTACAAAEFRTEDARLNVTYAAVVARLRGLDEAKTRLVTSERSWVAFRDAECAFVTNQSNGGSIYSMLIANCETSMTRQRINQLTSYLDCKEGDLSCPLPPR